MGTLHLQYTPLDVGSNYSHSSLSTADFNKFNVSLLGLGDLSKDAQVTNALAAVFDLEGFTTFCSQIDPQLVIPEYLGGFLPWLFSAISERFTMEVRGNQHLLWNSLPFFGKFMGDGVLFLWNTDSNAGLPGIGNTVVCIHDITTQYKAEFLPVVSRAHSEVPQRLRVGIARGQVFSVGDGNDYVGPCINMASRLQKLGALPFAFSRRGFDPKKCFSEETQKDLLTLTARVRGVGQDERIVTYREDFDALAPKQRGLFRIASPKK